MKRVFCEGDTDTTLVQYIFENMYGFSYNYREKTTVGLKNNDIEIVIDNIGGITRLNDRFSLFFEAIKNEDGNSDVIIVLDNDSNEELVESIKILEEVLEENLAEFEELKTNCWNIIKTQNSFEEDIDLNLWIIVLPQNREGALETFLLDCLKESEPDTLGEIILKCENFIDEMAELDSVKEKYYLKHRREIIKAKFNTFFCIATANNAFSQRHNILKDIKWEEFDLVHSTFSCFNDIIN